MAKATVSQRTVSEYEEQLVSEIGRLSFIVNGLKDYEPYQKLVEMMEEIIRGLDDSWHIIPDPQKLHEARVTKLGLEAVVHFLDHRQAELTRLQTQLVKLQNPDEFIDKDVDNE